MPEAAKVDYSAVKNVLVPYRRVSTQEQADSGAGLDAQKTAIGFGLQMRGQTALNWDCEDKGKSGKNLHRDGLTAALSLVEQGQAGGIIVSKLDRLSRSLLDFAYLMARAEKEGWNLVILDINVDLSTPGGKAMAQMLAIFAEFERNVISQRTKDGLAEKRAMGIVGGRRSNVPHDLLEKIVAMYQQKPSYYNVAQRLNYLEVETAQGGKQWYPYTVQKLIQSDAGQGIMQQLEAA